MTINYKENLKKSKLDVALVNYNSDDQKFFRCKTLLEECELYNISNENLSSLLEGELSYKNRFYQYLGSYLNFENFSYSNFKNSEKIGDTKIFYNDGVEFKYNEANNEIQINQIKPGSKIIFLKGKLIGTKIIFNGNSNYQSNYSPTNINGLTGCLTFFDLKLYNVTIEAAGSSCEDTVNFINVTGEVEKINIDGSLSDALDVDFSNIKIKNIQVKNAGNDCSDFSYGQYYLINLELHNCGDKALSIGEKSFVELNSIQAKNAVTGVASKDSSVTILKESFFQDVKTCISAYKKNKNLMDLL